MVSKSKKIADTPLMRQYFSIKAKYPDAILLFRVGDFYETFGEDAITASKVLDIVLTKRANGAASHVELAGFPHHALSNYLPKLVRGGYKVAVCDQLEDPKLAKTIVKRGVTELVTPGVAYNDELLSNREHNYLATIHFYNDRAGLAFLDISTGTFKVAEGSLEYASLLLSSLSPSEIVIERTLRNSFLERFGNKFYLTFMDEWAFVADSTHQKLLTHFKTSSLKGFGIESMELAKVAAGAALFYLEQNRQESLLHLNSISRIDGDNSVWIDRFTFRNLEVFQGVDQEAHSLISTIDNCSTPMGSRTLRNWLALPSKELKELQRRLSSVEHFIEKSSVREETVELLKEVGDPERLASKAAAGRINPLEVRNLRGSLEQLNPLKELLEGSGSQPLKKLGKRIKRVDALLERLRRELLSDPAVAIGRGDVIADGVDEELDQYRRLARNSREFLEEIRVREVAATEISSLKIGYNNVFGYYLEVRNTHKDKVPPNWIRKQTLVSAERYITEELKVYEEKILGAEEKIVTLESELFTKLVTALREEVPTILENSRVVAEIDCFSAFASLAIERNYSKPELNEGSSLEIVEGRHPVIEQTLPPGEEYIPNDLFLDTESEQIIILTGPNMAGKSALLRQTALIVLMAQIGSYVPAKSLKLGIVDKIFTRVGASDNISRGESTFMVEMLESATILHNLSPRSLVLLDEIGRGTSTYDGISIAWSIVEYLHQNPTARAKTLFATHYHELNDLETIFKRVKSWHISVKEVDKKIIFLRKLCRGGVEHSFGIHVARMAGMPKSVVEGAERVLKQLESNSGSGAKGKVVGNDNGTVQLSLFLPQEGNLHKLKEQLDQVDLNTLSPLEAFDLLRKLKGELDG